MPNPYQASVSLPRRLLDRIHGLQLTDLGYESASEFVRRTLEEKLDAIEARRPGRRAR